MSQLSIQVSDMELPPSPVYLIADERVTMKAGLVFDCFGDFMAALDLRLEIEQWLKQNGHARFNVVMNSAHREHRKTCYRIRMLFESIDDAIFVKLKYGG